MDKKALEAFTREAAKSIKTESDLDDFRKMLTKVTVETALNAELDEHLGYLRIFIQADHPITLSCSCVNVLWRTSILLGSWS